MGHPGIVQRVDRDQAFGGVLDAFGETRDGVEDAVSNDLEPRRGDRLRLRRFNGGGRFEEGGYTVTAGETPCNESYDQEPDTDGLAGPRTGKTQ